MNLEQGTDMNQLTCDTSDTRTTSCEPFALNEADVARMLGSLNEGDTVGRSAVRSALRALGPAAIPALTRCLDSHDVALRRRAAGLLRELPADQQAVPTLARAVRDEDWLVRLWCLDALGRLGRSAEAASAAIEDALDDPMPLVRTAAFVARCKVNMVC